MSAARTVAERIARWSELVESGCIEWRGHHDAFGYGFIQVGEFTRRAHRVAYELARGPIPDGLELDHLCRNHCCINPDHLEPVTHRENVLRGNNPMAEFARRTACANGHIFTPESTYSTPGGWRRCKTCHNANTRRRYHERRDR